MECGCLRVKRFAAIDGTPVAPTEGTAHRACHRADLPLVGLVTYDQSYTITASLASLCATEATY